MRLARILLSWLMWAAVGLSALLASLYVHLNTDLAQRVVREVALHGLDESLQGSFQVEEVERLTFRSLALRDVTISDPEGRPVAHAERLSARLALVPLLHGTIRVERVRLHDGYVRLLVSEEGELSIVRAFASVTPEEDEIPSEPGPTVEVPDIVVDGLEVTTDQAEVSLRDVMLRGGVWVRDAGVVVAVEEGRSDVAWRDDAVGTLGVRTATLQTEPGTPSHVALALASEGDLLALEATAVLAPVDPQVDGPQLEATLQLRPLSPEGLRRFGQADLADALRTDLRGHVTVKGTPDHLVAEIRMDTQGGPISVDAEVTERRALDASITAPDLDLAAILAEPPLRRVGGVLRVQMEPLAPLDPWVEGPWRVAAQGEELRADTYRLPSVNAHAEVHDDHLRLEQLDLPYLEGTVDVRGRIGFNGAADLHMVADVADLGREPNLRALAPSLRGGLRGSVDLKYRPTPESFLETDLDLVLTGLRVDTLRARQLSVVGRLSGPPDRPRIRTRMEGRGMNVGVARLHQASLQAVGDPDRVDVQLRAQAPGDRRFSLDGDVRTTREGYAMRARMLAVGVAEQTWRGRFHRVHWVPDVRLEVERFVLARGPERLALDGTIRLDPTPWVEASLEVQQLDLALLEAFPEVAGVPLRGRLDLTARVVGPLAHPATALEGALTAGRVQDVPVEDALFRGRWAPTDGTLEAEAYATLGDALGTLALTTHGQHAPEAQDLITAVREGAGTLEVALRDVDVGIAQRVAPERIPPGISGRLSGSARVTGDLDRFAVDLTLTGRSVTLPDVSPLDLTLEASYDEEALEARLEAHDGQGALASLEGNLAVDLPALVRAPELAGERLRQAPLQVDARMAPRPWASVPVALPRAPMPVAVSFAVSARREAQAPLSATLEARLRSLPPPAGAEAVTTACEEDVTGHLALRARLDDGETRARVQGFLGERRVLTAEASATTPVDRWLEVGVPDAPPEAQLQLAADVPELARVPVLCEHAAGALTVRASLQGVFGATPAARVTARSPDLTIVDAPALPMRVHAEADSRDAQVRLRLGDPSLQRRMRLEARIPILWDVEHPVPTLREDEPLRADLEMRRAPLGPLLAPVPGVGYPTGTIDGRVRIEGMGEDMRFDGALRLEDASLSLLAAGNRFEGMSGRVTFEDQTVRLERFETRDDGGHITATGRLVMRGLRPETALLELSARRFPIRTAGRTMGTLTTDMRATMRLGPTEGRVQVRMDRTNVALDRLDVPELQDLEPHPDLTLVGPAARRYEVAIPDEPVADDAYVLIIEIGTPTPFWVRRPDMAAQLEADLQVRVADTTTIHGRVEVLRGFFELVGRRFVLQRGSVQFTGAEDINPHVDLTAAYDLGGGRMLTMRIMGDLQRPQLVFATDEREIPTLGEAMAILLGPRGADRAGQQAVEVQAASVLSGITAGILTTTLRRELGDLFPVITVDAGGPAGIGAVRAGISADRIIPEFLLGFIQSAYVEGFVTTADPMVGQMDAARGRGGVLVEFRHPYDLTSTLRVEPPQNWSVDLTWDP